jgi:hypothetical protein
MENKIMEDFKKLVVNTIELFLIILSFVFCVWLMSILIDTIFFVVGVVLFVITGIVFINFIFDTFD